MIEYFQGYRLIKGLSENDGFPAIAYQSASIKKKERLDPNTQWAIREKAVVDRIQNQVVYANTFELRSFRLRLEMKKEEAE